MTDKKDNNQEIDLIALFSNIFDWFGKQIQLLFKLVLAIFYFFIRISPWLIIAIVIGFFYAKIVRKNSKLYYQSELYISTNAVNSFDAIKIGENWDFNNDLDSIQLSNFSNISFSYLLDINNDEQWDIVETEEMKVSKDTALMNQRFNNVFYVTYEVYDTALFETVKSKLMSYLDNHSLVVKKNAIRLEQAKAMIPVYEREIKDLDSLKKLEYYKINKQSGLKMGESTIINEKDSKLYHEDLLLLENEKNDVEKELFMNNKPFEIIFDYSKPMVEVNNTKVVTKNNIKVFLLIAFILALLFDQRKFFIKLIKDARQR